MVSQGKKEEAARLYEQASKVNPDDYQSLALVSGVYDSLGRSAEAQGARHRCLEIVERHLSLHPDDARALYLGAGILCQLGNRGRGIEWAERSLAMDPNDSTILYNVACVYSGIGEIERAIDCLEKSITSGMGQREWIENDTDLDPLRTSPAFRRLWTAETLSALGSNAGYVALSYQVYALTGSTLAVGRLALAELVPLLTLTLLGGALAAAAPPASVDVTRSGDIALHATPAPTTRNADHSAQAPEVVAPPENESCVVVAFPTNG